MVGSVAEEQGTRQELRQSVKILTGGVNSVTQGSGLVSQELEAFQGRHGVKFVTRQAAWVWERRNGLTACQSRAEHGR